MTEEYQALIVTRRPAKEMADGTLRVQFDVEPNDRKAFLAMFPDNGDPIAVARLDEDTIRAHQQRTAFAEPKRKGPHGNFARWLVQSGFFRRPAVWHEAGTDAEYLEWLRQQTCCALGKHCHGDVVAAHVRRIANGAGTGIKPEYSAVPLCDWHHRKQHELGESSVGGRGFLDRQRVRWLSEWSKEMVKEQLGVDSLAGVSPDMLEGWCAGVGVECHIPEEYQK